MTNCANVLVQNGVEVHSIGDHPPFHQSSRAASPECTSATIDIHLVGSVSSGAFGSEGILKDSHSLFAPLLVDKIMEVALDLLEEGRKVVVWSHYLFPFGFAALSAVRTLRQEGYHCALWITPAGSDIWELLPQLPRVGRATLSSPDVDLLLTYSTPFASEVSAVCGREVAVFKPSVNSGLTYLSSESRMQHRSNLGLRPNDFVVSFHSNMRPVKEPLAVVSVLIRLAQRRSEHRIVLLMAGPRISLPVDVGPLEIRQLGIISDVETAVGAGNVEINLSRHDSFNMSLAESMQLGLPIVTTDVVGIAIDIAAAGSGFLIPLEDSSRPEAYEGAVSALEWLLDHPAEAEEMGRRAGAWAASTFDDSQLWSTISGHLGRLP